MSVQIRGDDLIERVVVLDANEVTMTFDLTDLQLNPPVSDETFRIDPPEGTEVIDLRS